MCQKKNNSLVLWQKNDEFPQYGKDYYLNTIGHLFFDHQMDLKWPIRELEDFDSEGCRGQRMDIDLIGSKAIIMNQYDQDPEERAVEIDRSSLIKLVKAYDQLLKEKATEITLFRDDQNITIVGTFEDKP